MRPIDLGTHLCQLYEGEDELKAVTLPFISDGLRNGECCLYVADDVDVAAWYLELQAYDIDVRTARETGALNITYERSLACPVRWWVFGYGAGRACAGGPAAGQLSGSAHCRGRCLEHGAGCSF